MAENKFEEAQFVNDVSVVEDPKPKPQSKAQDYLEASNLFNNKVAAGGLSQTQDIFKDYKIPGEVTDRYKDETLGYNPLRDNEDFYAQQQSWYTEIPKAALKLPAYVLTKTGSGVGFTLGLINPVNWFNEEGLISAASDNAISGAFESLEETVKNEWAPTFQEASDRNKGFFSRAFTDLNFWTEDVVDGAAFMASAFIPGMALSKLGTGANLVKALSGLRLGTTAAGDIIKGAEVTQRYLSNAQRIAKGFDAFTTWSIATASESMFEAKEVRDNVLSSLEGKINPETGMTYTEEEKKAIAGGAAKNTFLMNSALLGLTNVFQMNYLFKALGKTTGATADITQKGITESFEKALPTTKLGKFLDSNTGAFIKGAGAGILSEGYVEENTQLAIQRMNQEYGALGKVAGFKDYTEIASRVVNQTIDATMGNDTEASTSIGLGGLLGGGMSGIGDVKQNKRDRLTTDSAISILNTTQNNWLKFGDIYKTEETTVKNPITNQDEVKRKTLLDENNEPVIDEAKLAAAISGLRHNVDLTRVSEIVKDKNQQQFLKDLAFRDYVQAHIEAGLESGLIEKLDKIKTAKPEDLVKMGFDPGVPENMTAVIEDMKSLATTFIQQNELIKNSTLQTGDPEIERARRSTMISLATEQAILNRSVKNVNDQTNKIKTGLIQFDSAALSDGAVDHINAIQYRILSQQKVVDMLKSNGIKSNFQIRAAESLLKELETEKANYLKENKDTFDKLTQTAEGVYNYEKVERQTNPLNIPYQQSLMQAAAYKNAARLKGIQFAQLIDTKNGLKNFTEHVKDDIVTPYNASLDKEEAEVPQVVSSDLFSLAKQISQKNRKLTAEESKLVATNPELYNQILELEKARIAAINAIGEKLELPENLIFGIDENGVFVEEANTLEKSDINKLIKDKADPALIKMLQDAQAEIDEINKEYDEELSNLSTVFEETEEETELELASGNDILESFDKVPVKNKTYPTLQKDEKIIDEEEGWFIVFNNNKFSVMDFERRAANGTFKTESFSTLEGAKAYRDNLIKQEVDALKLANAVYTFDGQNIRAGQILTESSTGKNWVVTTKGKPFEAKGIPKIKIELLSDRKRTGRTTDIKSLEGFTLKQKTAEQPKKSDKKEKFKLVRENELVRIYPIRQGTETNIAAQKTLDQLLINTPASDLIDGITLTVTKATGKRTSTIPGGTTPNANLRQNSERLKVEVKYKGKVLGFITNFDAYHVVDKTGKQVNIESLTVSQYKEIFDVKNKDPKASLDRFKDNYKKGKRLFQALHVMLGDKPAIDISNDVVKNILGLNVSNGEFDFTKDAGVIFDDLNFNTINGHIYVIDRSRRYGKGFTFSTTEKAITTATGADRKQIEKEIKEAKASGRDATQLLGRYVGVIKAPNGTLRFVELNTSVYTDEQLADLVSQINERSELTKKENLTEKENERRTIHTNEGFIGEKFIGGKDPEFNDKLNDELVQKLFISVPLSAKGTYVDFYVNAVGNLQLKFNKKVGEKNIKSTVVIKQKDETKPINLKDADDMIKRINSAINAHNKKASTPEQRIDFELTKANFKNAIPDDASVTEIKGLQTNLTKDVVKNLSLTYSPKDAVDTYVPVKKEVATPKPSPKKSGQDVEVDPAARAKILELMGITETGAPAPKIYGEAEKTEIERRRQEAIEGIQTMEELGLEAPIGKEGFFYADAFGVDPEESDLDSFESKIKQEVIDKINAKYDAELKKIESTERVPNVPESFETTEDDVVPDPAPVPTKPKPKGTSYTDKYNELIAEKQAYAIKRSNELQAEGMSKGKAMIKARAEATVLYDAKIQELKAKVSNTVLKVTDRDNFTESSVENIDKFRSWIRKNFPDFISVEELDTLSGNMKKKGATVGMFLAYIKQLQDGSKQVSGRISVGTDSAFKYHEAFHAVFRLLLNDAKIDQLLSIAKREVGVNLKKQGISLKKALADFRTLHPIYQAMSESELENRYYEEYLADKFDAWKTKKSVDTSHVNKSFFAKIVDLIKKIFSRLTQSELEGLFQDINRGKYRNNTVANNRFTKETALSITQPVLKAIKIDEVPVKDENGNDIIIEKFLSQQEGEQISSNIASIYHVRALSSEKYNKSELLNQILDDYAALYNPENDYYAEEIERRFPEDDQVEEMEDYLNRLTQRHSIFSNPDNRETLIEAVDIHLKLMGFKQDLEDDEYLETEDDFGSKVTTDNWKETHSIGGFGSLSQFLRMYIASTTFEYTDEFGNSILKEGEPLVQAVNANLVYNGILKSVANITDQNKFMNRLRLLKQNDTETGKFITKFFDDAGIEFNEDGSFYSTNPTQSTLIQQVIKGFSQYSVDYIFINKDIRESEQISHLMLANRRDSGKTQFSIWQNAYVSVFEDKVLNIKNPEDKKAFYIDRTSVLQDLYTLQDPGQAISDDVWDAQANEIANTLKTDLGISISPIFIKYSIVAGKYSDLITPAQNILLQAYDDVTPITRDDVNQIMKSIQAGENPFAKNIEQEGPAENEETDDQVEEQDELGEGGVITRLNKIAKNNAIFDETVYSTSFKNADGELVYGHQLPTFHLVKTIELNNQEVLDNLKQDEYLKNNYLLNSPRFEALQGLLKVSRIDGLKSSVLNETEEGYAEDRTMSINKNKGITYGSFSDREFLVSLFDVYAYNKEIKTEEGSFYTSQHLIRVLESSNTGDTVNLPVIKAVSLAKDGSVQLSDQAISILTNEVITEFERIKRVQNELSTRNFIDGEIDGYHYATDKDGKRNYEKGRGLKLYKTALMMGDLASEIESKASDPTFNISSIKSRIEAQLQAYWKDQIDNSIKTLHDLNIVVKNEKLDDQDNENEFQNKLLDKYISEGFTKKEDGKKVTDEKRNNSLNIIKGNLEHNVAQVIMNDFINTLSFNQLLLGDQAASLKDSVDEVKRAKGANGSGPSLESFLLAPELGINHEFKESHLLQFEDPLYEAKFAGGRKEKADGQMWSTVKGMRYTLFGLGKLTPPVAKILDKLEAGIPLTKAEIFGEGGLKNMEAMFNSKKLMYYDGKIYIKTSMVMLTKEFTSYKDKSGNWVPIPGREELHKMRENMENYENSNNTVAYGVPKSASKGLKKNIAADLFNVTDENFVPQETKYWRLQLENPSNKLIITDPTQAKQIIIAEQDNDLPVTFMGTETTIGRLKEMYMTDTEQRVKNNYTGSRNEIFNIEGAYEELSSSINLNRITPKLAEFQKRAIENLMATGADSQLIDFFSLDKSGQPKYNLNNSITLDKYTQLFLSYFSKGVMSEKVPGHSIALMSNYGVKVIKRFTGRYQEDGAPIGEVIRTELFKKDPEKYKDAKTWNNEFDRAFEGLVEGDYYIDDLRHNVPEYDKDGNIIGRFSEFMLPPHFKELMSLLPEDKIQDFIAKAFGVRIPSQDKHSLITLKLVDFMPAYYGSTGIFPHELIEISGADFDIDKLYMHIADTYIKSGELIPYGTATDAVGKFEEFVRYQQNNNKIFQNTLKEIRNNDVLYQEVLKQIGELNKLEKAIDRSFEDRQLSDPDIAEGFRTGVAVSRFIDNIGKVVTGNESVQDYADEYGLLENAYFLKDFMATVKKFEHKDDRGFALGIAPEIYKQFTYLADRLIDINDRLIGEALANVSLPNNILGYKEATENVELNNGVLNNRILAAKIALLNNDHQTVSENNISPIAFEVASIDPLKSVVDYLIQEFSDVPELMDIVQEGGTDTDFFLGKYKAFKNNKEGARNIGPAVNALLVYSTLSSFNIDLRDKAVKSDDAGQIIETPLFQFEFEGVKFNSYHTPGLRSYNIETGQFDGERIFGMISTLVSAMTDNAKERLAARLGLNIEAVGYVSNMLAQGVPLRSAIKFILQPSIREYFNDIKIINNKLKSGRESTLTKSGALADIINKYKPEEEITDFNITEEMLDAGLKTNGENVDDQYRILRSFAGIKEQTEYYNKVAQVLKLTKGLGTSFDDLTKIKDTIEELGLRLDNTNFLASTVPFDLRQLFMGLDKTKPYHKIAFNNIRIADQIDHFSKTMFLEKTDVFKRIKDVVKANLNIRKANLPVFNTQLKRDLISYLSIKAYMKFLNDNGRQGTLKSLHNGMIYDQAAVTQGEDFNDVVDTVKHIRAKLPNNYIATKFLNIISTQRTNNDGELAMNDLNRDGINKVEANTWAKLSEYQTEKLKDSFIEIYQNDETRADAVALFNYLLVKDGGQFRSNSFIRFVPTFMFADLLAATGKVNDLMKLDLKKDEHDTEYKKIFGVSSADLFNEFMVSYTTHIGNAYEVTKILNMTPRYDVNDAKKFKQVEEFKPESFVKVDNKIKINLFGGIREEVIEFDTGTTEGIIQLKNPDIKGKYSEIEKALLNKNKALLRARGFKVGDGINFPYVIVDENMMGVRTYYTLKSVGKKNSKGPSVPTRVINPGEEIANGVQAVYVKYEPTGSKKQWLGAKVFGEIPTLPKIPRKRKQIQNNGEYGLDYGGYNASLSLEELEARMGLNEEDAVKKSVAKDIKKKTTSASTEVKSPVQILYSDYGIGVKASSEGLSFEGDLWNMLPEKDRKKIKTPKQLLDFLGYEQNSPARDVMDVEFGRDELLEDYSQSTGLPMGESIPFTIDDIPGNIDRSGAGEIKDLEARARIEALFNKPNNPLNDECA